MNPDHYITLIYKKLKKELSPEEEQELSNWVKEDENAALQHQVEENWQASKDILPPITVDTQKDFAGFKQRMKAEKNKPVKKEAVIKPINRQRRFLMMAAAIALPLAAALWLFMPSPEAPMMLAQTEGGATKVVNLEDGTIITLNENSTLQYPATFDAKQRKVLLNGEAFFDVTSDPTRPFEVQMERANVKVLGTKFNIRNIADENNITVNVEEGKVQFSNTETRKGVILTKGEEGLLEKNNNQISETTVNHKNASAWKTKTLSYKNASLQSVVADLEKVFKTKVTITNETMQTCRITARFADATPQAVLEYVEKVYKMEVEKIDGENFKLKNGSCQ